MPPTNIDASACTRQIGSAGVNQRGPRTPHTRAARASGLLPATWLRRARAARALATARALARTLPRSVPELAAGIGVSFGPAVAGHIGSEARSEFTVIGDPVNEAARLTELAKLCDPMVLASMATVDVAARDEARRWRPVGRIQLRGRLDETRLAQPVGATAATSLDRRRTIAPSEGRPDADGPGGRLAPPDPVSRSAPR